MNSSGTTQWEGGKCPGGCSACDASQSAALLAHSSSGSVHSAAMSAHCHDVLCQAMSHRVTAAEAVELSSQHPQGSTVYTSLHGLSGLSCSLKAIAIAVIHSARY